ncbi:kinase [uncultured Dialister sp.]|uniref:GHMP family kinase ATP-binding protein n=1 Tax=uncultured Dialister sp. TaxID=278064 RepID=UPI00266F3F8A|nr:kinase [uncultured Dialister sp.]
MVITKTPFRMSFFGGGTDMKEFYSEYGGSVLSTTFDKYCYVTVRHLPKFFKYTSEFVYSHIERVTELDDIQHPLIRNCMKYQKMHHIRLAYDADLPARTGLGTSSSFAVGMLNAFHALKGELVDKKTLANEAIYTERVLCNEAGGIQDQIAASYGGLNRIDMSADGYHVSPIVISNARKQELNRSLMLFFTGFSHMSSTVQQGVKEDFDSKIKRLQYMKSLVDEAQSILTSRGSLIDFGKLLHESWKIKRSLSKAVSTDSIDDMYTVALKAGATGGKLLGSGGGGFLLFYVEPDKQAYVKKALNDLMYVPFEFETGGTRIIYYKGEDF